MSDCDTQVRPLSPNFCLRYRSDRSSMMSRTLSATLPSRKNEIVKLKEDVSQYGVILFGLFTSSLNSSSAVLAEQSGMRTTRFIRNLVWDPCLDANNQNSEVTGHRSSMSDTSQDSYR